MLQTETKYYANNRRALREKYADKYLVIRGKTVVGIYNTHATAYQESVKLYNIGTFLIQHCKPAILSDIGTMTK